MIPIYSFFWQSLTRYAAKYQLQMPTVDEFNSAMQEVQVDAFNLLSPIYQKSEKVRGLLKSHVRQIFDVADQGGLVVLPQRSNPELETTETFARVVGMGLTDGGKNIMYQISPASESEIVQFTRIPQRQPDLTKKRAYYIDLDDYIQLYPQQGLPFAMFYLVYPTGSRLTFVYTIIDSEYVLSYDKANSVDVAWDPSAANLLLYMLLEKYGISSRDDLLQEYGDMGIKFALVEPQIQAK